MEPAESLARMSSARSGHLATVRPDGRPHVVVVTFATVQGNIVTAIDHKPKTTQRLQRLVNIESNRLVSFLVDHYDESWDRLWWVRADGSASIHETGEVRDAAVAALAVKYLQYVERPPDGPVIVVSPDEVTSWSSTH